MSKTDKVAAELAELKQKRQALWDEFVAKKGQIVGAEQEIVEMDTEIRSLERSQAIWAKLGL